MNLEELLKELDFKSEVFPRFILTIRDANNDRFEIYKTAVGIKVYKTDWNEMRKRRNKETILKNIIFPVRTI